jgi:hypothetical protein
MPPVLEVGTGKPGSVGGFCPFVSGGVSNSFHKTLSSSMVSTFNRLRMSGFLWWSHLVSPNSGLTNLICAASSSWASLIYDPVFAIIAQTCFRSMPGDTPEKLKQSLLNKRSTTPPPSKIRNDEPPLLSNPSFSSIFTLKTPTEAPLRKVSLPFLRPFKRLTLLIFTPAGALLTTNIFFCTFLWFQPPTQWGTRVLFSGVQRVKLTTYLLVPRIRLTTTPTPIRLQGAMLS